MAKITGPGGAFLRAKNPQELYAWYAQHLGLETRNGCFAFDSNAVRRSLVFAFFPNDSDYFPVSQAAMLNFQVDDLDAVLDKLAANGVAVNPKRETYDFGRFGWFTDPEGNRVELWQPPDQEGSA